MMRVALVLTLLTGIAASSVTPMEKVISLLTDLKSEVEAEGKKEATAYAKFAKFCKEKTAKETADITKGSERIEELAATMGSKDTSKDEVQADKGQRLEHGEELEVTLQSDTASCNAAKAEYEATAADQGKAISSMNTAIKAMSKSGGSSALLQLTSSVREAVKAKTGVDPDDSDFKYHSKDILELLASLKGEWTTKKSATDAAWAKKKGSCTSLKDADKKPIPENKAIIDEDTGEISKLGGDIASTRTELIEAKSLLADDQLYLKDITASCESRAKDWDTRTAQRAGELGALTSALSVLTGTAKAASAVNVRAAALVETKAHSVSVADPLDEAFAQAKTPVLLQLSRGLRGTTSAAEAQKAERALSTIRAAGRHLGSLTLSAFAVRAQGNPFGKIKDLMEKLMQNLIKQAEAEATKKGFCDQNLAKTKHTAEHQFGEVETLSAKIGSNDAKIDELTESVRKLGVDLAANEKSQGEATGDRKEEKDTNAGTIKTAKEGLEAINEAMTTLKEYYSNAAKASLLQRPVEIVQGAEKELGFSGAYKGKQGSTGAIFGLLETIASDFERTIRTTEANEVAAGRAYQKLMQGSLADSAGKTTAKKMEEDELASRKIKAEDHLMSLQKNQDLLDDSLKDREALKPACIDTGMSYSDRVAKREQEIKALENAVAQLAAPAE